MGKNERQFFLREEKRGGVREEHYFDSGLLGLLLVLIKAG
jgi:hypothetical protein